MITVTPLNLPEVLLIEPQVFGDKRGFFMESFNQREFCQALGREVHFVQDNHSLSRGRVLRGLHYQLMQTQGKIVRCVQGAIFDVVVDIRKSSPNFGKWVGVELSAKNKKQLWIPEGFAHGFLSLRDFNQVQYKATEYYAPEFERTIIWSDPAIGIAWPEVGDIIISDKDMAGKLLKDAEVFA